MPDRPHTIALYTAGASIAAVALYYILGPSLFPDDELSFNHKGTAGAVGLSNPANDCFINSVLQAFAGLDELYVFLQEQILKLDNVSDAESVTTDAHPQPDPRYLSIKEGLQLGVVTRALQEVLSRLRDRPQYKRTISAKEFVKSLEYAFQKGLSRRQQDAQEFLQLVAERLCDENDLAMKSRNNIIGSDMTLFDSNDANEDNLHGSATGPIAARGNPMRNEMTIFPLEGKLSSQIECQSCHYTPSPSTSTFVTLTLNVPHLLSTSLDSCLDNLLKIETISDYKCDRCLLVAALSSQRRDEAREVSTPRARESKSDTIATLENAISSKDLSGSHNEILLSAVSAQIPYPKSIIAKHTRISDYPSILCLHLSRSIFDPSNFSTKNTAKVIFKESLTLGGLRDRKAYKLLSIITHRGGHNSGHYETFRRQDSCLGRSTSRKEQNDGRSSNAEPITISSERRKRRKQHDRWWRVSDDRIGDCRTADVLEMQREAYLLFYGQV